MSGDNTISIPVDVRNPGQFFACCGLLELADRAWGDAMGWFDDSSGLFSVRTEGATSFGDLLGVLRESTMTNELTPALVAERNKLEEERRHHKKDGMSFPKHKETRRKALGELLREGAIVIGAPFGLRLDWWQHEDEDAPKTFAGSQQVCRIARAALARTADAFDSNRPFDYGCVIRPLDQVYPSSKPSESARNSGKKAPVDDDKAEPFYFDSRHGASALPLDIGFSPNELGMESKAFPAVELLCLVGLQRCRPMPTATPSVYDYFPWGKQAHIGVILAPAAVCGILGQSGGLRFENAYRTDQRKHKGFLPAVPITR